MLFCGRPGNFSAELGNSINVNTFNSQLNERWCPVGFGIIYFRDLDKRNFFHRPPLIKPIESIMLAVCMDSDGTINSCLPS